MTEIELHRILLDSIKDLKEDLRKNTEKTSVISDKVINIENALLRIESFKNGQILFQEKVNKHILEYENKVPIVIEKVNELSKLSSEEKTDKRKTVLEIVKHAATAGVTFLLTKI